MTAEAQRSLRVQKTQNKTLLAVHPGALGDVVLFGHLLAAARAKAQLLPSAPSILLASACSAPLRLSLCLIAGGEKAHLLAEAGVVDSAMDFESLPMHEVFGDAPPQQCRLPGLLGPCQRLVSCFAAGDARAERRLAELCGAAEAHFLPTRPPAGYGGHLTELWAEVLDLPCPMGPAAWSIPDAWRGRAADVLHRAGLDPALPYAVIHPGAGGEAKCWPLERFLRVAEILSGRGLAVVFALGPAELDRWRDGRLARLTAGAFPLLAGEPLETLAGVLAGAALYLGNDSGVSHLAAAVGTPAAALFGPTSATHFRPLGRHVTVIARDSLERIEPDEVLGAIAPGTPAGRRE